MQGPTQIQPGAGLSSKNWVCPLSVRRGRPEGPCTECTKGAPWSYIWGRRYSNSKRYMHPNVRCSTFYNSQDMEATHMAIRRGREKDVIHTQWNIVVLAV